VVHEAAQAGIHIEVPAPARRRRHVGLSK